MKSLLPAKSLEPTIARINSAVSQVPLIGAVQEVEIPPRLCGIYFLLSHGDIVYIGQSVDIVQRIRAHMAEACKSFDRVLFMPCPPELLSYYEKSLIMSLQPHCNRQYSDIARGTKGFVAYILSTAPEGLTFSEILAKAEEYGIWAQTQRQLESNLLKALESNSQIHRSKPDLRYRLRDSSNGGMVSTNRIKATAGSEN